MRRVRAAIVALAVVAVVVAPGPAGATNFSGATSRTGCGNGAPVNMADSALHTMFYSGVTAATASAQNWTNTNAYAPTDIDPVVGQQSDGATDVIVFDEDYTTYCGYTWDGAGWNYWGIAPCMSLVGARCEQHYIHYDLSDMNWLTQDQQRGLACHETGHTLGLTHRDGDSGCMPTSGPYVSFLGTHNVGHLNANY